MHTNSDENSTTAEQNHLSEGEGTSMTHAGKEQSSVPHDDSKQPAPSPTETTQQAHITYDDFAKLQIKIGVILSVDVVENADKLLRLSVDVGEEQPRQIISGIRTYFPDPQFLVGKQCPFVANLEPRVIRGYESQGMILAANAGDVFALLIPHNELPPGTNVR